MWAMLGLDAEGTTLEQTRFFTIAVEVVPENLCPFCGREQAFATLQHFFRFGQQAAIFVTRDFVRFLQSGHSL